VVLAQRSHLTRFDVSKDIVHLTTFTFDVALLRTAQHLMDLDGKGASFDTYSCESDDDDWFVFHDDDDEEDEALLLQMVLNNNNSTIVRRGKLKQSYNDNGSFLRQERQGHRNA
jgi:hypothetical protein